MPTIELGKKYKDRITGFHGVATGHCTYISGCSQVLLAPPASPAGEFRESQWFDEQRLEQIGGEQIVLDNGSTPGADRAAPKR